MVWWSVGLGGGDLGCWGVGVLGGVEMLECWGVGALELQDNMCGCYWKFMVVEVMEIELHSCGGTGENCFRVNPDDIRVQHDACRAMQLEIRGMTLGTNRVL